MNIHVICVGKIREKYISEGIAEFVKRIQPYSSLKITEIPAQDLKHAGFEEKSREIEAQKILSQIGNNAYVITLEVTGKSLSSEKFAEKIRDLNNTGINQIVFIIGGATGLHHCVSQKADFRLSLSSMTLPHQLARLFLLEQIYRSFKIINGEPYHK